jgi:RNA polymerase sigma-70 factor, ECF subfamily
VAPGKNHTQPTIDLSEYLDGLYGYGLILSRDQSEAEDLVQETCLRALRAMERLRPDSNIKSWLFTILRNIWLNQVRQSRTAPQTGEMDLSEDGPSNVPDEGKDPYEIYVSKVERAQVEQAIHQLPLEFLEVILLREYEELSYEEIASLLQCPVGTVMSRLARARSKLRDLLAPSMDRPLQKQTHEGMERDEGSGSPAAWDQASGR